MAKIRKAILDGRELVESLRLIHRTFYEQKLDRAELTQRHIELKEAERGIEEFGFENIWDFYQKSIEADLEAGLKRSDCWR